MKIRFVLPLCALLLFTACTTKSPEAKDNEEAMDPKVEALIDELLEDLQENPIEMDDDMDMDDMDMDDMNDSEDEEEPVAVQEPVVENDPVIVVTNVQSVGTYTNYYNGVIGNGKSSVLFFHASWCPMCKANDTRLNDFYGAMKWGRIPENNNLGKFFAFN